MQFAGNHILSIGQFERADVETVFSVADKMVPYAHREKVTRVLDGAILGSMFFEPSTRTRLSFETAAKRLSADTMTFAVSQSSLNKGESLRDTIETIAAMGVDAFVIRHKSTGAPWLVDDWTTAAVAMSSWRRRPDSSETAVSSSRWSSTAVSAA